MNKLMKCPDCGATVSKKAASCPSCGRPLRKKSKQYGCGTGCLIVVLGAVALAFLLPDSPHSPAPPPPAPPSATPAAPPSIPEPSSNGSDPFLPAHEAIPVVVASAC